MNHISKLFIYFYVTNVHCVLCQQEDFFDISQSPDIFETTRLPQDENGNLLTRYIASVGNGHISKTLYTDSVYMNGLYNGYKGESHRARIPSKNNIQISAQTSITNHTYAIHVGIGTFIERFITDGYIVELRTFAHRYYHKLIVSQIHVEPVSLDFGTLELNIISDSGNKTIDIDFETESHYNSLVPSIYQCGKTIELEDPFYQNSLTTVCLIALDIPSTIRLNGESTFTYVAAYDFTLSGASADYDAVADLISTESHEYIFESHKNAWREVWNNGRIEIDGNIKLAKVAYGSLYYILSSLPVSEKTNSPVEQFYGLSPGGLAYGALLSDYQGHSFWDTEIWMYPGILYFFPQMAREMLNYRLHAVEAARDRAAETGYLGARFPWESCYTGREVTPDCCPETRDFQIHITGDVGFAIRQYIALTRDINWLVSTNGYKTNGCGLLREIAQFWVSRATFNPLTNQYDINGVMPPDEDHYDVNNSVYTNVIAGYAIFFAKYGECLCGESMNEIPDSWLEVGKSLSFLYNSTLDYHPEYEGYIPGTTIKQADVVLLGFPLMYQMDKSTRRNDLFIYENVTREDGPAMTWAMHTVGFLELDEIEKSESLFNRSYQPYMREPFKIWTEAQPPNLGAINFITGMGGFLQTLSTGYGGIRLYPEKIVFMKPRVPPNSESIKLIGLNYLDNVINLEVKKDQITLAIVLPSVIYPLVAEFENGTRISLVNNTAVLSTLDGPLTFHLLTETQTSCELPIDLIGGTLPDNLFD